MNAEEFRYYCLNKSYATEGFPFDDVTLVFKVAGKMFALIGLDHGETRVNLKCAPERSIELRETHPDIIEGFHMNKKHWNTVYIERGMADDLIEELIDHSYDLVVAALPKKVRMDLFKED